MSRTDRRGFASMTPERRRAISSAGGRAGKGHKWTADEARAQAERGGRASHEARVAAEAERKLAESDAREAYEQERRDGITARLWGRSDE